MHRIFYLFLLTFTLPLSAQLLSNAGFEGSYTAVAPGWNGISWGGANVSYLKETAQVHSGSAAQKIVVAGLGSGGIMLKQDYDFPAGAVHEGGIWLRADSAMKVAFMFQERVPSYFVPAAFIAEIDTAWQHYAIQGGFRRITSSNQTTIQGRFVVQPLSAGALYVDDASFSDVTAVIWNGPVSDTGEVPQSYFGMHINKLGLHQTYPAINFGTLRLWDTGTEWQQIEPTQGVLSSPSNWVYDASGNSGFGFRLEYYTSFFSSNNPSGEMIYTMGQTPSWSAPYADMPPSSISDWQNYVSIVGSRFDSLVKNWEVWNECDYYGTYSGTMAELKDLARTAHQQLKSIDASCHVLTPDFISAQGVADYLLLAGDSFSDIVSWHHYPSAVPEESIAEIAGIRSVMNNYGMSDQPLWNTEGAISYPAGDTLTEEESMAAVSRCYIIQWLFGVRNFNWYCWDVYGDAAHDFVRLSYSKTPNQYDSIAPAGIAYRETASWMTGAKVISKSVAGNTWQVGLQRPGYSAWIVWNTSGTMPFTVPAQWNIGTVRDLYGNSTPFSGTTLNIGLRPLLMESGAMGMQDHITDNSVTAFPNPFNEFCIISFRQQQASQYEFTLYNATGELVKKQEKLHEGKVVLNRNGLPAGMYYYLITEKKSARVLTGKLIVF